MARLSKATGIAKEHSINSTVAVLDNRSQPVYGQMPPGQLPPPGQMPPCFCHPGQKPPWIKRPRSNGPSGQSPLPVSDRENTYSVYYVIAVTGIDAMFKKK